MAAIPLRASYPSVGETIDGKYRITKVIGEGGMGMVARADHLLRKVPVALKFIAPHVLATEGGVERFLNEASLASQIPSDHVVGVVDVGKLTSGAPYMVMEHLDGLDVASLREEVKEVPIERAVHITLQILRALQAAHAVGVVHRDLKPSNVFLVKKDGDHDFVKLLDFGISKAPVSAGITATNAALGTPLYMSPEQAKNPKTVDGRADLYSAGVILYELLGGRTPHTSESGEATEVLLKLFTQEPPRIETLRTDVPKDLAEAVHKALAHDLDTRFQDAKEFAEALAAFAPKKSEHTLEKIRSFVPPEIQAAPMSKPDVFVAMGSEALAATQHASPAASTSAGIEAPTKPPARSLQWIVIGLVVAVSIGIFAAVKLSEEKPSPNQGQIIINSAPTPTPTPSTVPAPSVVASVLVPPAPSSASTTIVAPPPATSVPLKNIGLHP